ncbi:PREDICTED: uncharacterized protein LOC101307332 [Fragaria vesca subsp. vesca]|uniref:uncharacterized protein LOC101307332 n=1 Tax=Fragaria vesca subsp. vesca TaxID=101020 RepID=UPI0002C33C88|nr:PREDICTED: uncharacterized protein LOC101307332 [Fragaria vesca subsp. vesca]
MRPRNRIPLRERFSQNLEGKEHTDHTTMNLIDPERAPIYEDISSGSPNIIASVRENRRSSRKRFFQDLQDEGTSMMCHNSREQNNMIYTETTMSTKSVEEHADGINSVSGISSHPQTVDRTWLSLVEIEKNSNTGTTSNGNANGIGNNVQDLSSFSQAHYQSQCQGAVVEYKDFGDNSFQCIHCNAYYWRDEKNTRGVYTGCCKGGQVRLQPSKPTPTFLEHLLDPNNGAKGTRFRENIRVYNSMFAFTSMGADIVKDINKNGSGPYVFKICGQVYHLMGSVLPLDGKPPKFAQLYVYDTKNEISNRINALNPNKKQRIDPHIVSGLIQMFDEINELTKLFRSIRDKFENDSLPSFSMTMLSR